MRRFSLEGKVKIGIFIGFSLAILVYSLACGASIWSAFLYTTGFSGFLGFMMAWMSVPGTFYTKTTVYYADQTKMGQPD